jgi:hypothetical protein
MNDKAKEYMKRQGLDEQSKLRVLFNSLTKTAADLQHLTFPPLNYVVPTLIPEGLTLLAGKPKVGKSFLCLDVALAVSTGGGCLNHQCEQGDVMALFLEDTDRRMQRRIDRMLGVLKADWPPRLKYVTQFPRLDEGGLDMLYTWAKEAEEPRLIIIDLWERFRPLLSKTTNGSQYSMDYADLAKVQKLFAEFPKLGVMVTNHQRKATAEDIFDTISGTLGLNGGADTLAVLAREEGAKTLDIRGRDVEDTAIIVEQDKQTLRWINIGLKHAGATTPERRKIIDFLRGKGAKSPKQIHEALGGSYDAIKMLLSKMHRDDALTQTKYGWYTLSDDVPDFGGRVQ